ncbi:MAG: colicin D domain-containing protein [Actinomycetota bacterium]
MAQDASEIGNATRGVRAIGPAGNPGAFPRLASSSSQLHSKFKHAADFGISGSYSSANALLFGKALQSHLDDALRFPGTYRGESVIHNLNPTTGLNVIQPPAGEFITGWRLSPQQLVNLLERGSL